MIGAEIEKLERLGFGSLTHPKIEKWIARVLLLYRMRRLCQKDLIELRDSCLPGCSALFDLGRHQSPAAGGDYPHVSIETRESPTRIRSQLLWVDSWSNLCAAALQYPVANEWKAKIESWTARRHLGVEWFLDVIVKILCAWHIFPDASRSLGFSLPGSLFHSQNHRFGSVREELDWLVRQLMSRGAAPAIPRYNPVAQTREEHLAVVLDHLRVHHASQEKMFRDVGFKSAVFKRARSGEAWVHMDWFIKYQVHGQSAADIVDTMQETPIGENAVTQQVRRFSQLLEIPMRPRKTKKLKDRPR